MERIMHKSFYRKLILNLFILLVFLSSLSSVCSKEVNLKLRTAQLLKQLTTTRNQGMGGSLAVSGKDTESLHDNPAGLAFIQNSQLNFSLFRFPETEAYVTFPSKIEDFGNETHSIAPYFSMVRSRAYGTESVKYSIPLGQFGNIGWDLIFSHTGKFSRVNSKGKAINEFPESDLVIAFGYAKKLSNTALGVDTKFIRSKALDKESERTFVRGFVYDIGLIQKAGNFKFGAVWKNLSNGLSRPTNSSSVSRFELKNSLHIGATYHYVPLQEVELLFVLGVNPPFKHGIRGNIGSELCYRNWLSIRIGYVKDISDAFILTDESDEDENEKEYFNLDSLERTEGLTFGIGLQTGKLRLDLAFIPGYKLRTESKDFKLLMDDNNYSFSLSASYID